MGGHCGKGDDGRSPGCSDLCIDIGEVRHQLSELRRPADIGHPATQCPGLNLLQRLIDENAGPDAGVIDNEVKIGPVGGRLGDVTGMSDLRRNLLVGSQALMNADVPDARLGVPELCLTVADDLVSGISTCSSSIRHRRIRLSGSWSTLAAKETV